jgi:DNA-binding transcriptional MocR family regulator
MSLWSPRLEERGGPLYRRLADAIERDVQSGLLVAGSRMPTHRQLARAMKVTVITVNRGMAEANRRGLLESAPGRGTFIRAEARMRAGSPDVDLATNGIHLQLGEKSLESASRALAELGSPYQSGPGRERFRAAGAAWLGQGVTPDEVLVTSGAQHALFVALATLALRGGEVLTEDVTYHGVKSASEVLHLHIGAIAVDEQGMRPDALDRAARRGGAKVVYVTPTLHNPTGAVMSAQRREEIAKVAERRGLLLVEDDVYRPLLGQDLPPLWRLAPESTVVISGLGKGLAPALRVGFIRAPRRLVPSLVSTLGTTTLFVSPIVAEIGATWIEDGSAVRVLAAKREEISIRRRVAARVLGPGPGSGSHPASPHLWMDLGRAGSLEGFVEEARRRGVRVTPATTFAVGPRVPRAVRLCIGNPPSAVELERALCELRAIEGGVPAEPVV